MRSRLLVVVLLLALGVLGATWYTSGDLTVRRTVLAAPPEVGNDTSMAVAEREVIIMCSDGTARYVAEDGTLVGFNVSTWSYPPPEPFCEEARSDRARTALAFVVVGVTAGLAVTASHLVQRRRMEDPARRVDAAGGDDGKLAGWQRG